MTIEVLMSGEESTVASCWDVYLCVEITQDGGVVLSTRQYEGLADRSEFEVEGEDGEAEYQLPDEIGGKRVLGMSDDMVVGGELEYYDDDDAVRLTRGDVDRARAWLAEQGWDRRAGFVEVWGRIQSLLAGSG